MPQSDVPITFDVDVRPDGYKGILCQVQWLVAWISKVWDVAPGEGDDVVPIERVLQAIVHCWRYRELVEWCPSLTVQHILD